MLYIVFEICVGDIEGGKDFGFHFPHLSFLCSILTKEEHVKAMEGGIPEALMSALRECVCHGKILRFFALLSLLELVTFSLPMTLDFYLGLFCISKDDFKAVDKKTWLQLQVYKQHKHKKR